MEVNEMLQLILTEVRGLVVKVDDLAQRVGGLENRMGRVEDRMTGIEDRMESMEDRMESMEDRMESMEGRMTGMEDRMGSMEGRMDSMERRQSSLEKQQVVLQNEVREGFAKVDYRLSELEKDVHYGYELIGSKFDRIKEWQDEADQRQISNERWKKNIELELNKVLSQRGARS